MLNEAVQVLNLIIPSLDNIPVQHLFKKPSGSSGTVNTPPREPVGVLSKECMDL